MKSFLANVLGLFTRNWGLKLLALALAIVIYHALKPAGAHRQDHKNNDRTLFQSR